MQSSTLGKTITEFYTQGEFAKLEEALLSALRQHRERAVDALESLMKESEGKFRLKILETLMADGGPDLIPLYIDSIRGEKNALYAKSMILLFKDMRHQEALIALLSIESEIEHDLKNTYQRTLGRLLSNFSEQFYMSEFRAGIGDRRRVRFAADMMLRAPHDDYVPFLNELIQTNDMGYRTEGLRVLVEQGDETSSKAVFSMMNRIIHQGKSLSRLMSALDTEERDPALVFADLMDRSGIDWDAKQTEHYAAKVAKGDPDDVVEQLLDAFELDNLVRKKVRPLMKGLLGKVDPSTFQEMRTAQALQEYGKDLDELLLTSSRTLGDLAVKVDDRKFIERLEGFLPRDHPKRDAVLISSLAGFRNDVSFELLVEYANTCEETDLLEGALDSLAHYDHDQVPKGIEKLCFNDRNGVLRRKALHLASKWGKGDEIAGRLMDHQSLAVRADGIRAAAEHQLEDAYPKILAVLESPEAPDSLMVAAIEGVTAFDDPRSIRAVRPLLLPPNTFTVRKAALEGLFASKAADRIEQIVKAFLQVGPEKIWDSIDVLLNLVIQGDIEEIHDPVMKEREFWLKLMMKDTGGERRGKVLQLAERLHIQDTYQARAWVLGFKKTLAQMGRIMDNDEQDRIQTMIDNLEDKIRIWNERAKNEKLLQALLEGIRTNNPYQKVQGFRNLAQSYSPELVADNPKALQVILNAVIEELDRPNPKKEMTLKALEVARRMRHPKLHARIKKFLHFPDFDIRKGAKKAREMSLDPNFVKPIKTIFVMDDSRYITKQLAKVLARAGFEVDYENAVQDGLDRLDDKKFDLLVLDIVMPELSGSEFLAEARKREIAPEFTLVITSTRNEEDLQPLIQSGIDGLVLKPFRMDDIIEKIKSLTPAGS
ncbi:MAG: response regulator [Acidobacteriota bacterium]|nr:response regulator [Acidobacteriota bacterium]